MNLYALNSGIKVVGIPEGNLLQVSGNQVKLIGDGEVKVFESNHEIQTLSSGDSLNFLMN